MKNGSFDKLFKTYISDVKIMLLFPSEFALLKDQKAFHMVKRLLLGQGKNRILLFLSWIQDDGQVYYFSRYYIKAHFFVLIA